MTLSQQKSISIANQLFINICVKKFWVTFQKAQCISRFFKNMNAMLRGFGLIKYNIYIIQAA